MTKKQSTARTPAAAEIGTAPRRRKVEPPVMVPAEDLRWALSALDHILRGGSEGPYHDPWGRERWEREPIDLEQLFQLETRLKRLLAAGGAGKGGGR
jgi:hypothetical protein